MRRGHVDHVWGIANAFDRLGIDVKLLARHAPASGDPRAWPILHPATPTDRDIGWFRYARLVRRVLQHESSSYDAIYVRQSALDFFNPRPRAPTFVEINTFLPAELASSGRRLRTAVLSPLARRPLRQATGWVAVTPEVGRLVSKHVGLLRPTAVVGNGISANEVRRDWVGFRHRSTHGRVLIMTGWNHPWQGWDRALGALKCLDDSYKLWLVGESTPEDEDKVRAEAERLGVLHRLKLLPWTPPEKMRTLFEQAHLGLSALAIDRKGLTEAAAMKSRRYVAGGLPFVFNHHDPAIPASPFALQARDFSVQALVDAIQSFDPARCRREDILEFAERNLTWESIAQATLDFMETTVAARKAS